MATAKNKKILSDWGEKQNPNLFEMTINDIDVPITNIISLSVREYAYKTLPTIEIAIGGGSTWEEFSPVQEGQIIKLKMSANKESALTIDTEFEVVTYNISRVDKGISSSNTVITILGSFKANKILGNISSKSYPKMTSSDVITQIGDELEIEVDAKISSNDKMTWYRLNQSYYDFINTIIQKSHVGEDDAPFIYIDALGKLNYNSFRSAVSNSIKLTGYHYPTLGQYPLGELDGVIFSNFSVQDKSGFINKYGGNGSAYSYYDLDDIITYEIDPSIINSGLVQIENKTSEDYGKPSKHNIFGALNPNVYEEYFHSIARNEYIRMTLLSTNVVITVDANQKVKLMDKININVMSSLGEKHVQNETYSGSYIITGIVHSINHIDNYSMHLILSRNGTNKNKTYGEYTSSLKEV